MAHPNGVLCVGWCPATSSSSVRHVPVPAQGPVPKFQHSPGGLRRLVSGGCDHQVRLRFFLEVVLQIYRFNSLVKRCVY